MSYLILALDYTGEGHQSFDLGLISVTLVPRFNYSAAAWSLDILDTNDNMIVAGLMMTPYVDILKPYLELKQQLGSLVPIENRVGDYKIPQSLGFNLQLVWYPVGVPVVLPI
jgi:hypothetical protein